jgi:hypothetical protein
MAVHRTLSSWLCLLALAALARAFLYLDRGIQQTVDQDTGLSTGDRYIDVDCEPSDWANGVAARVFTIRNADQSRSWTVTIKCTPPEWWYTLELMYYVPRDGRIFLSDMCIHHDLGTNNQTSAEVVGRTNLPASVQAATLQFHEEMVRTHESRLLKRILDGEETGFDIHEDFTTGHLSLRRKKGAQLQFGWGNLGSALSWGVCMGAGISGFMPGPKGAIAGLAVGMAAQQAGICNGPSYPSADTLNAIQGSLTQLKGALNDQLAAQRQVFGQINSIFKIIDEQNQNQRLINANFQDQIDNVEEKVNLVYQQNGATMEAVRQLSGMMANKMSVLIDGQVRLGTTLYNTNLAIGALAANVSVSIQDLNWRFQNATVFLYDQTQNLRERLENTLQITFNGMYALQQFVRETRAILVRTASRYQERRAHTQAIRTHIATAQSFGLRPWLSDLGANAIYSDQADFEVQRFRIRYFKGVSGYTLQEDILEVHCTTSFVIDSLGAAQMPNDLLNAIGPDSCTPGVDCNCFWVYRQTMNGQGCTARDELTGFGYSDVQRAASPWYFKNAWSPFRTEYGFNSSWCKTTPTSVETPNVNIVNMTVLIKVFQDIGNAVYDWNQTTFSLSSFYGRTSVQVSPYDAGLKTVTFYGLLGQEDMDPTGLVPTIMRGCNLQQMAFVPYMDILMRNVDGELPNEVSSYDRPFSTINGSVAACSQVAFMAYSTEYVPVYVMRPAQSRASLNITVTENVEGGETRQIEAFNYDLNSATAAMPGATRVVGNPDGDSNGRVYNVNERDIGTGVTPGANANTISYNQCSSNSPSVCTPQAWRARYQNLFFDAFSGSNVPALYVQQLTRDVNGVLKCQDDAAVGDPSNICSLRRSYNITTIGSTAVIMRPLTVGRYRASFKAPVGTITQNIISDCPVVTVSQINTRSVTLDFYNLRTEAVYVDVIFDAPTCCGTPPDVINALAIAGSSRYAMDIPACSGTCRQIYATVYRTGGAVCANATSVNVSSLPSEMIARGFGNLDAFTVVNISQRAIDYVATVAQAKDLVVAGALAGLVNLLERVAIQTGVLEVDLDVDYSSEFDKIRNTTGRLADEGKDAANGAAGISLQDLRDLDARLSDLRTANDVRFNAITAKAEADRAEAGRLRSIESANIARMNQSLLLLANATERYLNASQAMADALNLSLENMAKALNEIKEGSGSNLIGGALSSLAGMIDDAFGYAIDKAQELPGLASAVYGVIGDQIQKLADSISGIFNGAGAMVMLIIQIIVGIIGLFVGIFVVRTFGLKALNPLSKTSATSSGPAGTDASRGSYARLGTLPNASPPVVDKPRM